MIRSIRVLPALLLLVAINVGSLLHAQSYSFRRVVDSSTTVPGTSIPFGNRDVLNISSPSISGSNVAFGWVNRGDFLEENGSLGTLLQSPVSDRFALSGSSHVTGGSAIVRETGGSLTTLVDASVDLPGVVDTIQGFGPTLAVSGDNVVFTASETGVGGGIYTYIDGVISLVVETGTVTSLTTFTEVTEQHTEQHYKVDGPSISGDNVAFVAEDEDGLQGLYTHIAEYDGNGNVVGHEIERVLHPHMSHTGIRNGPGGVIETFAMPSMSGTDLAFYGVDLGGSPGIYAYIDGELETMASTFSNVPGGGGVKFSDFGELSFVNGQAAFMGADANGGKGIYLGPPGALSGMGPGSVFQVNALPVIQKGDLLDGRIVADLGFSRFGYDGTSVAFSAEFTDGTAGIYVASMGSAVPEPSTYVMAGMGLVGLSMLVWRRRRRIR